MKNKITSFNDIASTVNDITSTVDLIKPMGTYDVFIAALKTPVYRNYILKFILLIFVTLAHLILLFNLYEGVSENGTFIVLNSIIIFLNLLFISIYIFLFFIFNEIIKVMSDPKKLNNFTDGRLIIIQKLFFPGSNAKTFDNLLVFHKILVSKLMNLKISQIFKKNKESMDGYTLKLSIKFFKFIRNILFIIFIIHYLLLLNIFY